MNENISNFFKVKSFVPKRHKLSNAPKESDPASDQTNNESPINFHIFDYDSDNIINKQIHNLEDGLTYKNKDSITWLSISGGITEDLLHQFGGLYDISPLTLEDIKNPTQRPKVEEHKDYIYIALKSIIYNKDTDQESLEQINLIVGKNYVISFQENHHDILKTLQQRISIKQSNSKTLSSSYLLYLIIDIIVDGYFNVLEFISEKIQKMEKNLINKSESDKILLTKIYNLKQELLFFYKYVRPVEDIIHTLCRTDNDLITKNTSIYFDDISDHIVQIMEALDAFRNIASDIQDYYLSSVNNKMNDIMKVLALFTAVFTPATFLAGVYGMNFKYISLLNWEPAYTVWWLISLSIMGGMLVYFKIKKWF